MTSPPKIFVLGLIEAFLGDGTIHLAIRETTRGDTHELQAHELGVLAFIEKLAARNRRPLTKVLPASLHDAKRKRAQRAG